MNTTSQRFNHFPGVFLACLLGASMTGATLADTLHWTGQGGGGDVNAWDNPANWLEGRVPEAADRAVIEGEGKRAAIQGVVTLAELNLGPGATLDVMGASAECTVTGAVLLQSLLRVYEGGRMTLLVSGTITGTGQQRVSVEVSGAGSQLSIPNLTQIRLPNEGVTGLNFVASGGGRISLPLLQRSEGRVWFEAVSNPGGEIDLAALEEYVNTWDGYLSFREQGVLRIPQLRSLREAGFWAQNQTANLASVQILDGATITVGTGAQLEFPGVTGITNTLARNTDLYVRPELGEAVLSFPNLTTLARSPAGGSTRFDVRAGGKLRLPKLAEVAVRTAIDVQGAGAVVELPILSSYAGDLDQNAYMSVSQGAQFLLGEMAGAIVLKRMQFWVGPGGVLRVPELRLETGSGLSGSGQIVGNVINASGVDCTSAYEPLTIVGNYTQTPQGSLAVRITGAAPPSDIRQLVVSGNASIAGQLYLATAPDFSPPLAARIRILSAGSLNGEFDRGVYFRLGNTAEYRLEYLAGGVMLYAQATDNPTVVSLTPDPTVLRSVSEFTVTFSEPVQVGSVLAWLGTPDYQTLTATVTRLSSTTFRLAFPLQDKEGIFHLSIYNGIADWADNSINGRTEWTVRLEPEAANTYAQWRIDRFGPVDALDDNISAANVDFDHDGVSNLTEYYKNTDPKKFDTDGDGYSDGAELQVGANPLDGASTPREEIQIIPAVDLRFQTQLGTVYQVQVSYDLLQWSDYGGTFVGTGDIYQQYVTVYDRRAVFFRMKRL